MSRLYDVSPPLTPTLAVFPGDTPLQRDVLLRRDAGCGVTLSSLRSTAHLGAHVDAPLHYGTGAASVDEVPLERLLGPCRLVRPGADHVTDGLLRRLPDRAGTAPLPPRVLLATGSFPDPERWTDEFVALDPSLVDRLADAGVRTIGVDTPSVDPAASKELPAHAACLRRDVTIVEGLVLHGVPAGDYELIALPLRLVGFDGSPVRAVLRTLD